MSVFCGVVREVVNAAFNAHDAFRLQRQQTANVLPTKCFNQLKYTQNSAALVVNVEVPIHLLIKKKTIESQNSNDYSDDDISMFVFRPPFPYLLAYTH